MTRTLLTAALLATLALLPAAPVRRAAAQPGEKAVPVLPDEPGKDAEPLPPAPKADPDSTLTKLTPNGAVYLEVLPNKKGRRVLLEAEVCLREGFLEMFLCKKGTKEHESVVRVDADARVIHAALIAAGVPVGKPAQFLNAKGEPEYKPATGGAVAITVHYTKGGKAVTHPAQEWIWDAKAKKAMAYGWVFAGSREVPGFGGGPAVYAANAGGEVVSISNFPDSVLEIPVEVTKDDSSLAFEAKTDRIPPLLSKVWVILEADPVAVKK